VKVYKYVLPVKVIRYLTEEEVEYHLLWWPNVPLGDLVETREVDLSLSQVPGGPVLDSIDPFLRTAIRFLTRRLLPPPRGYPECEVHVLVDGALKTVVWKICQGEEGPLWDLA
jgi:hypothetical protein